MLKLPEGLTAESFLERHWQKQPLFMPAALGRVRPSITRNELGWLATLDDVESRLVFVDRDGDKPRYRAETGPFDVEYLQDLPCRDWSLLIHDVEKHLPAFRAIFQSVPFIPDWRIDDLMISFAAPGGGVGPHRDNYDVFLCQGIGVRNWRFTVDDVHDDPDASADLALIQEFDGTDVQMSNGDVLYLPPGVAHWGIAKRACITYSIGMRAPDISDLADSLGGPMQGENVFYRDPDLKTDEAIPGYLSTQCVQRAVDTMKLVDHEHHAIARALGEFATRPKASLAPETFSGKEVAAAFEYISSGGRLLIHGMSLVAFDDHTLYVNGSSTPVPAACMALIREICRERGVADSTSYTGAEFEMLTWLLQHGAFDLPVNS